MLEVKFFIWCPDGHLLVHEGVLNEVVNNHVVNFHSILGMLVDGVVPSVKCSLTNGS